MKTPEARRIEQEFQVPTSDSLWPQYFWIACVVVPARSYDRHVVPTDVEIKQIRSYIEFKVTSFYREGFAQQVLEDALPICAGHNTVILGKYPETAENGSKMTGWGYRRMSWETASWPHAYQGRGTVNVPEHGLTLVEVLDHCEGYDRPSEKWEAWKAAHPDLFA